MHHNNDTITTQSQHNHNIQGRADGTFSDEGLAGEAASRAVAALVLHAALDELHLLLLTLLVTPAVFYSAFSKQDTMAQCLMEPRHV